MCPSIQMNHLAVYKGCRFQIEQQVGDFFNLRQPLQWTQLLKKPMRFDGILTGVDFLYQGL
jgi:hypothetical protein